MNNTVNVIGKYLGFDSDIELSEVKMEGETVLMPPECLPKTLKEGDNIRFVITNIGHVGGGEQDDEDYEVGGFMPDKKRPNLV